MDVYMIWHDINYMEWVLWFHVLFCYVFFVSHSFCGMELIGGFSSWNTFTFIVSLSVLSFSHYTQKFDQSISQSVVFWSCAIINFILSSICMWIIPNEWHESLNSNDIIQSIDKMNCELVVVFCLCYGLSRRSHFIHFCLLCVYICVRGIHKHVIASYTILIKLNGDDKKTTTAALALLLKVHHLLLISPYSSPCVCVCFVNWFYSIFISDKYSYNFRSCSTLTSGVFSRFLFHYAWIE